MIQNHFVDEPTGNSKTALLCGGLSQEMYQALAAIQTAAGCLKQEIHHSANEQMIQRTQWMLDHVHQGTLQLYRIAENLEDMLAAEQGTLLPQLEPVELVSQYEQLIELLRTACANQGIQLEWHCQVEGYPVFLNCDGGWADKILLNVVSNAVLASTSGQTVWVEVRFAKNSQRSDTLEIVVRDEGPGLPQEVQNHLYEVFVNRYQSSENCVSYGAGLGLYLAHYYCSQMGWEIEVKTGPQGTEVMIVACNCALDTGMEMPIFASGLLTLEHEIQNQRALAEISYWASRWKD